jgi:hypothetical protein
MAKRLQAASAQKPQGESQPEDRWWKSPTVIAAIIAGVAAISVAIIQLSGPKPKPSAPLHIEQQTHDPGSPAIGQTGGNVVIHRRQDEKTP